LREFATKYENRCALFQRFPSVGMSYGVTFKASCLKKVGRFNTELRVEEDTDFFFRVLSQGFVPVVVPGIQVVRRDHLMARLSSPAWLTESIRACEEFLHQYSDFMDKYPPLRTDLLNYLTHVRKTGKPSAGGDLHCYSSRKALRLCAPV